MYKIRIKSSPSDKQTGQQEEYGLVRNNAAIQVNPEQVKVNNKMGAIPREEANIEVEGGESAVGDVNNDGIMELMHFTGKRHSEGGVPVNVPEGTFIYSDTKKLTIKDPEILEKMFNLPPRKKGYTPAEISKKYEINQYVQILKDETADEMTKRSAAEMLRKNKQKLGILAFIQESMKGFPDGIPTIAEEVLGTLGINAEQVIQEANQQVSQEQQQQAAMQQQMMQQQMPPQEGQEPTMENPVSGNINAQEILDQAAESVLQEDQQQPMLEEEMPMAMGGLVIPKLKKYEDAGSVGDPPLTQEQINKLTGQLLRNRDLLSRYDNAVNRDYTSSIANISYDAPTQEEADFARTQIAEIEKLLASNGVNLKKPLNTILDFENLYQLAEVPVETEAKIPGIGTIQDLEEFKSKSSKHKIAANLYLGALQYNSPNPYEVADRLISTAKLLESKSEGASSDPNNFNIPWSFDWWPGSDQDKISENWPSILREKALKIYNEKQKDIILGDKEVSTDTQGNPILDVNGNIVYRERNEDEKFTPDAIANKLKKLIEHYEHLSEDKNFDTDAQLKHAERADKLKEYLTFVNNPSSVDAITALDYKRDIRGGMPSYKTWYDDVLNSKVTNTPGYERNTNIFNLDNYTSDVGYPITDYRIDPFNDESQTVMGMLKEINQEYDSLENLYTASGKVLNKGKTNIAQKYQFPFAGINSNELFEESSVRRRSRKGNIFNTDIAQVDKIRQNIYQSKTLLIDNAKKYMNESQRAEYKNREARYLKNYPGYTYWYPKDPNAKLEWYKVSPETGGLVAITPEELAILNEEETLLNKRAGNDIEVKIPASVMAESDSTSTESYPSGFDNVLKDSTKYTNAKAATMPASLPVTTNTVQPSTAKPYVAPSTKKLNESKPQQPQENRNQPIISFDVLKSLNNKKYGGTIRDILNKEKGRYKFGGTIDKYGRILKRYDLGAEVTDDLADPDPTTDVTPKTGTPELVFAGETDAGGGQKYKIYKQTFPDGTVYDYIKDSAGNVKQVINEGTQQIYNDPTYVATRGNTEWITKDNLSDWEKTHIAKHWNGDKGIDEYIKVNNSANKIATNPRLKQRMFENLKAGIDSPDKLIFSHGKNKNLTPEEKLKKRQAQANRVVGTRMERDPKTGKMKQVNVTLEQEIKEAFQSPDDVMRWLIDLDTRNARMKTYGYESDLGGGLVASDAPNATGKFAGKTNKEAQKIIEANPEALGDISFDQGHLGQAAYLGFAKTIIKDPEFQGKAFFKPTGTKDEDVWDLPAAISPSDKYSTNTTLKERIELTDLIPPQEKTTTEEKKKNEITSSGKVKKSAYYCVEYTDGNRRIETVTYEEGTKPVPPNAANIKSAKELQSPNDSCAAPYEGSTPMPDQSTRWFAPDLVNLATGLRQRVPYTPPTLREMPMAPSGYDLLNPITQIAGVTGLVKQQQDLAMNTMDPTVGFAATAGLGYDELAKRIGDVEMQNVGIVNNWYDRTANRAMQVDQYNTNARRQFDIDTAVAREERARDLNKKDAQLAMLWGQGWKNAMNDNAMRVAYPNAWHVDRGRGTFNWSGVGRDPLMPDTYYSPVSGRGDADDISNQAITVYNDAERMFLQQNPGQTAEAKKHAAAMQKYYLDQQNKQSGKRRGNSQVDYNSGLPGKFKNGGLYGFGAYYTNPFD